VIRGEATLTLATLTALLGSSLRSISNAGSRASRQLFVRNFRFLAFTLVGSQTDLDLARGILSAFGNTN